MDTRLIGAALVICVPIIFMIHTSLSVDLGADKAFLEAKSYKNVKVAWTNDSMCPRNTWQRSKFVADNARGVKEEGLVCTDSRGQQTLVVFN